MKFKVVSSDVESNEYSASDPKGRIEQMLSGSPVFLFMKGTPESPQCGFSNKVTEILRSWKVSFQSFDVLSDESIRQGIKEYANWPTIPQLYVKGEFVGGSDIIREMYESGELTELFSNKGVELEDT